MSNHLAVAAVTATLHRVLQRTFDNEAPDLGATVTHVRPNASSTALPTPGANLFLFQVTPNVAARNADLPTRRLDGTFAQRPRVARGLVKRSPSRRTRETAIGVHQSPFP